MCSGHLLFPYLTFNSVYKVLSYAPAAWKDHKKLLKIQENHRFQDFEMCTPGAISNTNFSLAKIVGPSSQDIFILPGSSTLYQFSFDLLVYKFGLVLPSAPTSIVYMYM